MHVSVRWSHIGQANELKRQGKGLARSCPVALAVCEMFHLGVGTVVAYMHIGFVDKDGYQRPILAKTPASILDWMEAYDSGKPVEPIEFDVKLEALF